MRSLGASRSEIAINVSPEEVQCSIGAAGIDVEVLEVIAHDEASFWLGIALRYVNRQFPHWTISNEISWIYRG